MTAGRPEGASARDSAASGGSQRMTETIVDANGTRIYMIQIACIDPHTTWVDIDLTGVDFQI